MKKHYIKIFTHCKKYTLIFAGLIQAIAFHIFGLNACFSTVSQETETLKPGKKLFSVVFR